MKFEDRVEAAEQLAEALESYKGTKAVVLGLPRGGAVLAAVIAKQLYLPLDVVLVRKITHPYSPEYAIGSIAEGQEAIYNSSEVQTIDPVYLEHAEAEARALIAERHKRYFAGRKRQTLSGKTVIIVDDGVATGFTMKAAIKAIKQQKTSAIVIAVPVLPGDTLTDLQDMVDEVVYLAPPNSFKGAVGAHYRRFGQVDDEEVKSLLNR